MRFAVELDGGVVDQHVEAAEQFDHPGEQRVDRVLVGHIGRSEDMDALRIDLGELVDQRLRRLPVADEVDRDVGALFGKTQRRRTSDAGRRPGDQNPLAIESVHESPQPQR